MNEKEESHLGLRENSSQIEVIWEGRFRIADLVSLEV